MIRRGASLLLGALLLPTPGTRAARIMALAYRLMRIPLQWLGDPVVRYPLGGGALALPVSHDLPPVRQVAPTYGRNLETIAAAMAARYPAMTAIDIGANVGDTALLMRSAASFPILCIDGDPTYGALLAENVADLGDVEVERAFVAADSPGPGRHLDRGRGTARLAVGGRDGRIVTASLETILARHPRFADPALIKVDTDGLDAEILMGAESWLAGSTPALFFEYDPTLASEAEAPSIELFEVLRRAGYGSMVAFDNLGEYLFTTRLDAVELIEDMHRFASRPKQYADLFVVSEADAELAQQVRSAYLEE